MCPVATEDFLARLRRLREEAGYETDDALSLAAHLNRNHVRIIARRWEDTKSLPTTKTLRKLAAALGVSLGALIGSESSLPRGSARERAAEAARLLGVDPMAIARVLARPDEPELSEWEWFGRIQSEWALRSRHG